MVLLFASSSGKYCNVSNWVYSFNSNLLTPVWPDRDDFIHVHNENIEEGLKLNFKKRPFGDADFGVKGSVNTGHSPYDVFSAQKS